MILTGQGLQPADLNTRTAAAPKDLTPGSASRDGIGWTARPKSETHSKKKFGQASVEEMRKDMMVVARTTVMENDKVQPAENERFGNLRGTWKGGRECTDTC